MAFTVLSRIRVPVSAIAACALDNANVEAKNVVCVWCDAEFFDFEIGLMKQTLHLALVGDRDSLRFFEAR